MTILAKIHPLLFISIGVLLLPACGPSDAPPDPGAPAAETPGPISPAHPVAAGNPPALTGEGSPAAITGTYLDGMERGDWATISDIFHPDALIEFRKIVDFLETSDQHPGAVQARAAFFAPGTTPQTVAAFTNKELFTRVMSALMGQPQSLATISATKLEVIGTVPDGDDRAYVVIRSSPKSNPGAGETIETVSFKRDGETWKVTLTGSMRNNLIQLRNRIGSVTGSAPGAPPSATPAPASPLAPQTAPPLAPKEL